MRHLSTIYLAGLAAWAFAAVPCADGAGTPLPLIPPQPPATPSAGLLNDFLQKNSLETKAWDLGGQVRTRHEIKQYFAVPGAGPTAVDFRADTPKSVNDYVLIRTRFHVGYAPYKGFSAYVEAQNSATLWDQRNPNPENDAGVDVRQAYISLGDLSEYPLTVRLGRQELAYGDSRLVGVSDWNNLGRTFEAAKVRYVKNNLSVDVFTGRVIIPDDNNFNQPNWFELFSGIYLSSRTAVRNFESQFYVFADNAGQKSGRVTGTGVNGSSPRDIYTAGVRLKSLPGVYGKWDFLGEFAGQMGNFQYGLSSNALVAAPAGFVNGQRLKHQAWAAFATVGYSLTNVTWSPRAALEYQYATGDSNPTDGRHGTFVNLFPTTHDMRGAMDFFSWQNMQSVGASITAEPMADATVKLEYHAFWLATTSDFFYQSSQQPRATGGYSIHPGAGSFVGQEVDLVAKYNLKSWATFEVGVGHFFVGGYVSGSFAGRSGVKDANWVYAQAKVTF